MNRPQLQSLLNFQLIKFEPNNIILRSRINRKLYKYREDISVQTFNHKFDEHHIVSPIFLQTGALLECGYMNTKQLLQKTSDMSQQNYGQQEIVNTLSPILQTLHSIHSCKQVHGSLSAEAVFIDDFGDVRLFYPAPLQTTPIYYIPNKQKKKEDDYRAFAILSIQLMGYANISPEDPLGCLKSIAINKRQDFSIQFILSIYFMLIKNQQYLSFAFKAFNTTQQFLNSELIQIYDTVFLGKTRKTQPSLRSMDKAQFTPPLVKHSYQQLSPRKVLQMTRKLLKVEDLENKKMGDENKKKKPSDTALKKMSNCKIEGQNTTSPTYKKILRDLRETKEREDLFKAAVTVKRMRTISKKKIN